MYLDGMPRRAPRNRDPDPAAPSELNVNQIVAYNLRAARKLNHMTQKSLAQRLTTVSGTRVTDAMVSEMERAWDGERRREFDAHEIAVFAVALKVPMAYFFLPPLKEYRDIEQLGRKAGELHLLMFGYFDNAKILDDRMFELGKHLLPDDEYLISGFTGGMGPWSYEERRKELIMALLDGAADDLDEALKEVGEVFDRLRKSGIRGFIAQHANDEDFGFRPENRPSASDDTDEPSDSPSSEPPDDSLPDAASPSPEPASTAKSSR